jgi:hypothetical protein
MTSTIVISLGVALTIISSMFSVIGLTSYNEYYNRHTISAGVIGTFTGLLTIFIGGIL